MLDRKLKMTSTLVWLLILKSLISVFTVYQPIAIEALVIKGQAIYAKDNSVSHTAEVLPDISLIDTASSPLDLTGVKTDHQEEPRRTKFLILTTGDKIKLYPLVQNQDGKQSMTNEQIAIENQYYLIKPVPLNVSYTPKQLVEIFGNNSFTRWNIHTAQRSQNSTSTTRRKISILPKSIEADEDYSGANHGWNKPLITDVDYFFDAAFCPTLDLNQAQINKCLVVVWLDKNNKYVRYGSLDLRRNPIGKIPNKSRNPSIVSKNKILWLTEFPPIDLNLYGIYNTTPGVEVFAMAIDKQRSRIYVSFSDGRHNYANRLLSGKLTALPEDRTHNQLNDVELLRINECLDDFPETSLTNTSFKNLNIDEDSGSWLFYFDQHGGGKIFALQTSRWSYQKSRDLDSSPSALQALVRDISIDSRQTTNGIENKVVNTNATGLAVDPIRRRLYWLNEASELFSSDYVGYDVHMIGKLTRKPVIRSLGSMQVFQDTLLMSDPIKRSLIAYNLPKDDNSSQLQIQPTHQVLLVESPALLGFRVIDVTVEQLGLESSRYDFTLDSLFNRVSDSSQCGYRTAYCLDNRLFFGIVICRIIIFVVIIFRILLVI